VAFVITPSEFPRAFDAVISAAEREAVDIISDEAFLSALERSSGPFSSEQLADMDHPYARRHGYPLLDPGTINVQTGAFKAHWRRERVADDHYQVVNDDEKAEKILFGDFWTFNRPIDEAVEADTMNPSILPPPFRVV
jgi:hypothetical protein